MKCQRMSCGLYDIVIMTKEENDRGSGGGKLSGLLYLERNEQMPYRSNVPCKHPNCPKLIPYGQLYCEEHKKLHTKDRAFASERGYGARWQKARKKFLETNPFCVKCFDEGILTKATVVDHIKPHRGDPDLFWNVSNWQPLCEHHHNVKTMTEDRYKEYKF